MPHRSIVGLPLTLEGLFRPWLYQVSHGRLLLRHVAASPSEETVDVSFFDVRGMKVRADYQQLVVEPLVDLGEAQGLADIPGRHLGRYLFLNISDGVHHGFVVCGACSVYAGHWGSTVDPMLDPPEDRRQILDLRPTI